MEPVWWRLAQEDPGGLAGWHRGWGSIYWHLQCTELHCTCAADPWAPSPGVLEARPGQKSAPWEAAKAVGQPAGEE